MDIYASNMAANTTLKIENTYSQLFTDDQRVKDILWGAMRHRERNYFHNVRYKMKLWDGYIDFFKRETGRFLTGLLPEVRLALKQMAVEYTVIDKRNAVKFTQEKVDEQWLNKHLQPGMKPVELRDYQVDYINQSIRNLRGIVYAPTSCHRKGAKILMYDGTIKFVEDIVVGDKLMGPDSMPRTVLNLCRGKDEMYEVCPKKGESFVVNGSHYLTLKSVTSHANRYPGEVGGKIIDVQVKDYLNWSKWKKHIYKLFRVGVEFSYKKDCLPINPYFLGVLLGDGTIKKFVGVTTTDEVILDEVKRQANIYGLDVSKQDAKGTRTPTYYLTSGCGVGKPHGRNGLVNAIKSLGLRGKTSENKFIPHCYKTASVEVRLQVLAGLIDTDGGLNNGRCYDFISKSAILANDVVFLARSLGFHADVKSCVKKSQTWKLGRYYRVYISGALDRIPCRLKGVNFYPLKDASMSGFTVRKVSDSEDYYGFQLDGDHRYLMHDFTVTHNSGKTNILIGTLLTLPPNTPTLVLANRKSLVDQNYDEIRMWGIKDVGRFYGDHKEVGNITCATVQSAHLLKGLFPKVQCLFVDEIHEMMSKKPRAVYNACRNASVRIGMSATPFKFGEKDKVQKYEVKGYIGPVFVASNTETGRLSTKDLQAREILASADCVFYPVHEPKLPYHIYLDAVTDGIAHNMVLHEMTRRLVNTLDGRTLIIVERISHGDLLHDLIPGSLWVRGQDNIDTRKDIIKKLKENTNKTVAIATSGIFNTGINVFVHNLINCAGGQAEHQIVQRFGRGLRVADDKKHLKYYDWIFTNNDYLEKHSWKRVDILQKEGHKVTIMEGFDL